MDAAQTAHVEHLIQTIGKDIRAKYEAGQLEHGGNLWEKPGMLEAAIAEVLDLAVYLYTLRDQRDRAFIPTGRD